MEGSGIFHLWRLKDSFALGFPWFPSVLDALLQRQPEAATPEILGGSRQDYPGLCLGGPRPGAGY